MRNSCRFRVLVGGVEIKWHWAFFAFNKMIRNNLLIAQVPNFWPQKIRNFAHKSQISPLQRDAKRSLTLNWKYYLCPYPFETHSGAQKSGNCDIDCGLIQNLPSWLAWYPVPSEGRRHNAPCPAKPNTLSEAIGKKTAREVVEQSPT